MDLSHISTERAVNGKPVRVFSVIVDMELIRVLFFSSTTITNK